MAENIFIVLIENEWVLRMNGFSDIKVKRFWILNYGLVILMGCHVMSINERLYVFMSLIVNKKSAVIDMRFRRFRGRHLEFEI